MKNKILKSLGILALAVAGVFSFQRVRSATYPFVGYLANETGLAFDKLYTLNVNSFGINSISAQAVYSSATFSAATFQDGGKSTGSFTIVDNTVLNLKTATDTLKVLSNSGLAARAASNLLYVSSNPALTNSFINLAGMTYAAGREWQIGDVSSKTATNIAAALDTDFRFSASASASSVTITCEQLGSACNSLTLSVSTPTALRLSSSNFIGGYDPTTFSIFGVGYKQGVDWTARDVSSNTVISIVNGINARENNYIAPRSTQPPTFTLPVSTSLPNVLNGRVVAVASNTWVVIQAVTGGSAGNLFQLASSSPTALSADSARFQGGADAAAVGIDGVILRQGISWSTGATAALTAVNIAAAINANATLAALLSASSAGSVIFATTTKTGSAQNYTLFSSTPAITTSPMLAGTNSAYAIGSGVIALPSHGFTTALPVLFTSGTISIGGLTNQATYYVVVVDANDIGLSSTSVVAQSGAYITLTSSTTQLVSARHTFTLSPLANAGTPAFYWQASNDGTNWLTVPVSSVSIPSYSGVQQTSWDFGVYDYQYLRLNVTGPTQGGLKLGVYLNTKN